MPQITRGFTIYHDGCIMTVTGMDFLQVAERTVSDKKGGHLAKRLKDGRLVLRESAMTPDEDKKAFEDISKHKFFNTNNLWVNLEKLKVCCSTIHLDS